MSLLSELKRRNVFKVGAAYLALVWVVVQITATLTSAFHLPASALPLVTWIGVIGFPFIVLFSWVFELTPEGLRRESGLDRAASITHVTSKRLDYIIIGLMVLAIGLFALQYFRPSSDVATTQPAAPETSAAASTATRSPTPEAAPGITVVDKSIAVLPFVDMSPDKDQEYMSDGLAEELLNLLTKIPQLRVIARTSSFAFKGKEVDIAEIAKKLNVAHVLEGSVRKSGNKVRITAQLIRASDSSHLWSETYDRSLDDVFAIQDEISAAVVEQLKINLLGAAPKAKETDPAAYVLYLQARQVQRQGTAEGYEQSIVLLQQALAIAPDYAPAWAGLSESYSRQADKGLRPIAEGYTLSREAADKALAIDPGNAAAHAQLGGISTYYDGDLSAAAWHIERALQLDPVNLDIFSYAASLNYCLGRAEAAVALDEYAAARDPVNAQIQYSLGYDYIWAGRLDEAIASLRTTLSLSPGWIGGQSAIGDALLQKGEPDAALVAIQQEASAEWRLTGLAMAYHALDRAVESDAALAELIDKYEQGWPYQIAYVLAYRGEVDRAFEWLDKAVQYKDPGLRQIPVQSEFTNIHKDPRWLPFLESIGKSPAQLDAIEFKVTLPE